MTGILSIATIGGLSAQIGTDSYNPIPTAVPSLTIAPDARAGGMGDAGVATAPDVYSQYWNPAKYAFSPDKAGAGLGYTPWLKKIVDDIYLAYGVGYYKIGSGDNQAISASIRYFSIGDVEHTSMEGASGIFGGEIFSPYELAVDVSYSRKLTETYSMAVTLRYIHSDYSGPTGDDGEADGVFAADIAGYNESYINLGQSESLLSFGFNISNIGGKLSNNGGASNNFIPTNMRLGASLMYPLSEVSTISASVDLNKLLVPTPPIKGDNEDPLDYAKRVDDWRDINSISGIFKSFGSEDGGFSEKLKEIAVSVGAEYDYNDQFKVRAGYFHENKMKGNRRYFTFGAGFKMKSIQLDAAYLLSTVNQNPLDQTLRFSLAYNFASK
ncbi:hypothetical protein D0T66_01625 [Dysgonomonas sp. 25]|nr:hypothetical protein [Dysgonomonas sp. 25]